MYEEMEPNVIFVMENTSKYIAFNYIVVLYINIFICCMFKYMCFVYKRIFQTHLEFN